MHILQVWKLLIMNIKPAIEFRHPFDRVKEKRYLVKKNAMLKSEHSTIVYLDTCDK
jgi:hypothetical protein